MKINSFLLMSALVLVAGCDRHHRNELSTELPIRVSVDVQSRAGITTDKLQELGMFVVNGNSEQYDNVLMLKADGTGTFGRVDPLSKAPLKMVWGDAVTPVDVIAYAPYRTNATQVALRGSVALNQSDENGVVESDLVCQKMSVIPSENVDVNGNLAIAMNHQLSKLTIDLEFYAIAGGNIDHDPISGISVQGTKTDYSFHPLDGSFSEVHSINSVIPFCSSAAIAPTAGIKHVVYECILVPQRVAAGTFKVKVTLYGVNYTYVLPSELLLASNVRYELSLKIDRGGQVTGDVTHLPWGTGSEDVLLPDLMSKVKFNQQLSTFPEHHIYDVDKRELTLSRRGGVVELVFDGMYDKDLTVSAHDDRITIADKPGSKYKNTHLVITARQPWNSYAYFIKLKVRNALVAQDPGVEITINVQDNAVPSVVMANLRWMAYNGIGRSEDLYPPLELGETVRDVYRKHWNKYSAGCGWGNRTGSYTQLLYPWEVVTTGNAGAHNSDVTWANDSPSIPCPDGWRVPSKEEYAKIWPPNGVHSVGGYTVGRVYYNYTIQSSGHPEIPIEGTSNKVGTRFYVISDGKSELLFPFTGWRRRNDYASNQKLSAVDAGNCFYLWTNTRGGANWNAHIVGLNVNGTIRNGGDGEHQAMTEAYNGVRCVQNL